jgi:hypothetical protein
LLSLVDSVSLRSGRRGEIDAFSLLGVLPADEPLIPTRRKGAIA